MTSSPGPAEGGQTRWLPSVAVTLRGLLRTEASSAGVLLAAIVLALVWANVDDSSYESVWRTDLVLRLGDRQIAADLRTWVNSGLMAFFFLVVGLEARRELDLGELRERRRFVLPLLAGSFGMLVPVLVYLAVTAGTPAAHGWGVAMSTDTALALGFLSLLGEDVSMRVRVFLLTIFIVDDLVALLVIAVVYSESVSWQLVGLALVAFAGLLVLLRMGVRHPLPYLVAAAVIWALLLESGVDPVVSGLAIGLVGSAYAPDRGRLEEATGLFRDFREQPTAELARTASVGLISTLSPNARLLRLYLPWSSYVVVPLFGLANAGVVIDGDLLGRAVVSPITLGIVGGYVVGKPVAVLGVSAVLAGVTRGRLRPPVGWFAVAGCGTIAGTAFTVSLLIASLAFDGPELAEAKLGVMTAAVLSAVLTALVFRTADLLPQERRVRALQGRTRRLVDLVVAVDLDRDHFRGPAGGDVTLLEYGDFECPYCGEAEPAARAALADDKDLVYVWRHLPLTDVHPRAQLAAEASEAAAAQGHFWEMHDLLLSHQDELGVKDLIRYAGQLGLDAERFREDLRSRAHERRVATDVESADLSNVSGTPTFFINGQRHYGAYDRASLEAAIRKAREAVAVLDRA
jgi:Na+/H+ antiporter NhaA